MSVIVKVPAKVILFGEHAVVSGHDAIVAGVDRHMLFECVLVDNAETYCSLTFNGETDVDARMLQFVSFAEEHLEYRSSLAAQAKVGLRINITSEFPVGAGMGASSAICVGLSTAALLFANRIDSKLTEAQLTTVEKMAHNMEKVINKNCSGLDTCACVWGGLLLFSGETKAHKRIPSTLSGPLSVIQTGRSHDTADAVRSALGKEKNTALYKDIHALVHEALDNLGNATEKSLKALMQRNHDLLVEVGVGSPEATEINAGIPGSKISGAGCGGVLVALELSPKEKEFLRKKSYKFETVHMNSSGTVVQEPDLPLHLGVLQRVVGQYVESRGVSELGTGFSTSPSNIAVLKYWGKRDGNLQMAENSSMSYTICGFRSFTKAKCFRLSDTPPFAGDDARVCRFLAKICPIPDHSFAYTSYNNFPSSCGIASSASGFNAIVGAVADCLGLDSALSPEDKKYYIDNWTRIGSGSAARSTHDGFVSWEHQEIHQVVDGVACKDLGHCVVVFNPMPKEVTSSDGHRSVKTSLFHSFRKNCANVSVAKVKEMLRTKTAFASDWENFVYIMETDAMIMHAVMCTSIPPAKYLTTACMDFVDSFMHFRNTEGVRAGFTIDAGPNPHILYHKGDETKVLNWLKMYPSWVRLLINRQQTGGMLLGEELYESYKSKVLVEDLAKRKAIVVSGKRYGGKSWLTDQVETLLEIPQFALSEDIKRSYCKLNSIDADEMLNNRDLKERHRAKMVEYCEKEISHSKHVWDWSLWSRITSRDARVFIVSDLRRAPDLKFFKQMTDCIHVRVTCSDEVRIARGWKPANVDSIPSETGLDAAPFDVEFRSDVSMEDSKELENVMQILADFVNK